MPLYSIPVALPYRTDLDAGAPIYNVQIETVASSREAALSTAKALCKLTSYIRFGEPARDMLTERALVGEVQNQVVGPYCYIITKCQRIPHLSFPPRLDKDASATMIESFKGLQAKMVDGILMDCAPLTYIDSSSMSALASCSKTHNLQLFRVLDPIMKIMTIVGLNKILPIHADINSAMDALLHNAQQQPDTIEI